jgi:hypothetical protein
MTNNSTLKMLKQYWETHKIMCITIGSIVLVVLLLSLIPDRPGGSTFAENWLAKDHSLNTPKVEAKSDTKLFQDTFEFQGSKYAWVDYLSEPGDSFAAIAQQTTGTQSPEIWNKICWKNKFGNCSSLRQGVPLKVPQKI